MNTRVKVLLVFILSLVFVSVMLLSCSGAHQQGQNFQTNSEMMRVRWFPVDTASGYVLGIQNPAGSLIYEDEIQPIGCQHQSIDGYTAGLCEYLFPAFSPEEGRSLELRAYNQNGQGTKALITTIRPF